VSVIQPLLTLQEIDGRIRDLDQEIKTIPDRKTQELGRLATAKREAESAHTALKGAQVKVASFELEVASRKDKILNLRQTQGTLKTNKEFQVLNLEIASLEKEIEGIEARLLAAMDEVTPLKTRLTAAEEVLKQEESVVADYQRELDDRLALVQAEMARVQAERTEALAHVAPQHLAYYERLKNRRWPCVVRFNLDAGVCGGCNLVQTPSTRQMVQRGTHLVACESCGRVLYRD